MATIHWFVFNTVSALPAGIPAIWLYVVMQTVKKEKSFENVKEIQNAFYMDGKDTNDWQLYADIAENFGISKEAVERLSSTAFLIWLFLDNITKKIRKIFIHRTLVVIAIM